MLVGVRMFVIMLLQKTGTAQLTNVPRAQALAIKLQSSFAFLSMVGCTAFYPKPFAVKGLTEWTGCMQISLLYKTNFLLKPFINVHLAFSEFGMRHPKAVSRFVSFLGSNAMGMRLSGFPKTGI